ncbi:MAG: carboxylating nicotinate-nucleotide diphosphorylase [Candidatus Aminicenantaceae bacterium]
MNEEIIDNIISLALKEDIPHGDITSESVIPLNSVSGAVIVAKEDCILSGLGIAEKVFKTIDDSVQFKPFFKDGQSVKKNDQIASLSGRSISLLKGERTALNFIQRMSGIATKTNRFVKALEGTKTKILDTRKTTPGLRVLEKYAVKMGGGENHRLNLSSMVIIKDNHIQITGSISDSVQKAKEKMKKDMKIEVEARNFEEVKEAINSGVDMVMLDNMGIKDIKKVVQCFGNKVLFEVSGNVDLEDIKNLASTGVDFISVGALTHSYKSIDLSMEIIR